MAGKENFYNLHTHGFVRVATATPLVTVADPDENTEKTLDILKQAHQEAVSLLVFPELGISGYALDDLFFQDALLDGCERGLKRLIKESAELSPVFVVGMPLRVRSFLYNVAAIVHRGQLLGFVPKMYLPNYREFYEARQFTAGTIRNFDNVTFDGSDIPFGDDLIFKAEDMSDFTINVEVCEDVWVPIPPSSYASMAGAHVIANLSASNVTVGKSDYRHQLCRVHSARTYSAYLYSAAGRGESTTDLAWDGHAMIYENGALMAETKRFSMEPQLVTADVDLECLRQERMRHTTFADVRGGTPGPHISHDKLYACARARTKFGL